MESLLFGIIDNAILILTGFYGAFSISKLLEKWFDHSKYNGLIAGLLGAGIGNAISDFVAGLPLGLDFAFWVFIGCLIPLPLIFILLQIKKYQDKKAEEDKK